MLPKTAANVPDESTVIAYPALPALARRATFCAAFRTTLAPPMHTTIRRRGHAMDRR
jgi:hypothetical protein